MCLMENIKEGVILIKLMYKINNLREKISDKLLFGAVTLDGLLGNPSIALAETKQTLKEPNYLLSGGLFGVGVILVIASNEGKKAYEKGRFSSFFEAIGYISMGAAIGTCF